MIPSGKTDRIDGIIINTGSCPGNKSSNNGHYQIKILIVHFIRELTLIIKILEDRGR
jgi:hypothetical protein